MVCLASLVFFLLSVPSVCAGFTYLFWNNSSLSLSLESAEVKSHSSDIYYYYYYYYLFFQLRVCKKNFFFLHPSSAVQFASEIITFLVSWKFSYSDTYGCAAVSLVTTSVFALVGRTLRRSRETSQGVEKLCFFFAVETLFVSWKRNQQSGVTSKSLGLLAKDPSVDTTSARRT